MTCLCRGETCILGKAPCSKYFTALVAKLTSVLTFEVLSCFKVLVYKPQPSEDSCGKIRIHSVNLKFETVPTLHCLKHDGASDRQTQTCKNRFKASARFTGLCANSIAEHLQTPETPKHVKGVSCSLCSSHSEGNAKHTLCTV